MRTVEMLVLLLCFEQYFYVHYSSECIASCAAMVSAVVHIQLQY
jgi:hypothetical protein